MGPYFGYICRQNEDNANTIISDIDQFWAASDGGFSVGSSVGSTVVGSSVLGSTVVGSAVLGNIVVFFSRSPGRTLSLDTGLRVLFIAASNSSPGVWPGWVLFLDGNGITLLAAEMALAESASHVA